MKILEILLDILSERMSVPSDPGSFRYLDSGQIDSFSIVQLIAEIEEEFDIEFSPEDTQSDEFRYIDGLVSIIERYRDSGAQR